MHFITKEERKKLYKIKYKINMLPLIGIYMIRDADNEKMFVNEGLSIMDLCSKTSEINVFLSRQVDDLIEFKWKKFGFNFHFMGCVAHIFYLGVMTAYINLVYVDGVLTTDE